MQAFTVFIVAVVFTVLSTLSLLAKNEGIRGMGRVFDGIARVVFALFVLDVSYITHQLPSEYVAPAIVLVVLGIVTFLSGARKFARRKLVS